MKEPAVNKETMKLGGILNDVHRRKAQLRVRYRYLVGLECLILIFFISFIFSADKLFVSISASVIGVLAVEVMRYWFNYPFNRLVIDRFCKKLVTQHSKELESVVDFIREYDNKESVPLKSVGGFFSGLLKIGKYMGSDSMFELQSRMRMGLFTKMRMDFWILKLKSRQDVIGLVAYLLCRYNSWHPRFGFTYPKGKRGAEKALRIIKKGILKDYQKKYGKRYGKKIANYMFRVKVGDA